MLDTKDEMNPNVVGFAWFSGNICLVISWDPNEYDEDNCDAEGFPSEGFMQARICSVVGNSQEEDIQRTIDWGGKFPLFIAEATIDYCGAWIKHDKLKWRPRKETNSPLKLKLKYKNDQSKE